MIREFKQGRIFFARLDHGADIISQITNAHAVLSDRTGRTFGGHLTTGTIFAAELFLQELSGLPLKRVPDSITGLNLWGKE